jgi:anti-sigma-K factor RskA
MSLNKALDKIRNREVRNFFQFDTQSGGGSSPDPQTAETPKLEVSIDHQSTGAQAEKASPTTRTRVSWDTEDMIAAAAAIAVLAIVFAIIFKQLPLTANSVVLALIPAASGAISQIIKARSRTDKT